MTLYSYINIDFFLFLDSLKRLQGMLRLNFGSHLLSSNVLCPIGNKNSFYFAEKQFTYSQGLCTSLWITKNL